MENGNMPVQSSETEPQPALTPGAVQPKGVRGFQKKLVCPTCGEKALSLVHFSLRLCNSPFDCNFCKRQHTIREPFSFSMLEWPIWALLIATVPLIKGPRWLLLVSWILLVASGIVIRLKFGRLEKRPEKITF